MQNPRSAKQFQGNYTNGGGRNSKSRDPRLTAQAHASDQVAALQPDLISAALLQDVVS